MYLATLYLIIATYIHILVGGYAFIYLFLTLFFFKKTNNISFLKILRYTSIYIVSISFLVFYLRQSLEYAQQTTNISPDWIYTYFRSPHHTALAPNLDYFYDTHFFGILLSFIFLVILVALYKKQQYSHMFIHQFVMISLAGTLSLVPLAFLDKTGVFLKFYPYRINTLTTFFLLVIFLQYTINSIKKKQVSFFYGILILLSVYLFIPKGVLNARMNLGQLRIKDTPLNTMCEYIRKETDKDALIFSFIKDVSITRKTERSLFSVEKFIPAEVKKINQWYSDQKAKKSVLQEPSKIDSLIKKEPINYVLCPKNIVMNDQFVIDHENDYLTLYKVMKK